jgi:NADP-dependent 3-hydroxy acid dehydrogenase YdfG
MTEVPTTHPGRPTAVVTGASSGIGAATARALAAAGFRVICAARRTDRIEALAAEIDGDAVTCDVTSADDVEALAAAVGDRLDVLVNNAGGAGIVVNVGSIAGRTAYEGGGGYTAAKHALAVMTETLRLELWDRPVRITEIAPGMVQTEGFSLVRFGGDKERADKVYEGVKGPLVAEDIADAIVWMATRPAHVNVDLLVIKPRAQAAPHKVDRER